MHALRKHWVLALLGVAAAVLVWWNSTGSPAAQLANKRAKMKAGGL